MVALTKADLVDADILDLVRLEVEELVAGSFLEGAPAVAVSSVTGLGLDELRKALGSYSYTSSLDRWVASMPQCSIPC